MQVGKRHRNLFPHKDVILACPYCDKELSQAGLHEHLASQGCPNPGVVRIPASQIRKSRQKDLDKDPRFAPIIEVPLFHAYPSSSKVRVTGHESMQF